MDHKIIYLLAILLLVPFSSSVEIRGFVNDYADIIDDHDEAELSSILKEIYDSGAAEYAVVTVGSLEGRDIESYSLDIAQGVLGNKEKDNGLLLLVAVDDKRYRFEVGRGIEYVLNDAKVGRIGRQYLQPDFEHGDYGKGIIEASKAVKSILLGDNASAYYVDDSPALVSYDAYDAFRIVLYLLLFFIVFILPLIAASLKNKKSKGRYFDAAAGAIILFGGRGRGGFGGGGFGGGGLGGFGGFGGGGFGGGGASGGWR